MLLTVLPLVFLAFAFAASSAFAAGRLVLDGHDPDYHCGYSNTDSSCDFFVHAVPFVRAGAPDPTKPVLVLDRNASTDPSCSGCGNLLLVAALQNVFGSTLPTQVVDPGSPTFATLPLTTSNYSAIIVASDEMCGGCDLNNDVSTMDSNALAARKADFNAFFQAGGGIIALSGGQVESEPTGRCDTYYSFIPVTHPACQAALGGTFTLTPNGAALGFKTTDFPSPHNEFTNPAAGSPLQAILTDGPQAVALFGAAPLATTEAATSITKSGAAVHGAVNPEYGQTTYQFEYGTTTAYGHSTPVPAGAVGSDATSHAESANLSGLKPSTTYHFRIVATNPTGTTFGADMTFKTAALPKLALKVSPRSAKAGTKTCFAFTVSASGHRISKATVRLAGHSAKTNGHGRAKLCLALKKGSYKARASKKGFVSATARVRITAAPTSPAFTG